MQNQIKTYSIETVVRMLRTGYLLVDFFPSLSETKVG